MPRLFLAFLLLYAANKLLDSSIRTAVPSSFTAYAAVVHVSLERPCCSTAAQGPLAGLGGGPLLSQRCLSHTSLAAGVGGRAAAFLSYVGLPSPGVLVHGMRQALGPTGLQMSEKRYKEQLMGKKFTSVGRSSIARHYRIQGRRGGQPRLGKATGVPTKPIILPARRCMLLGKMDNRKARSISHSGVRTHRVQRVNLAWKRLWWPEGGHYVRLRLSMKGLKTIKKYGLQRAADKFKLNLEDKRLFAGYSHRGKYRHSGLQEASLGSSAGQQGGGPSPPSSAALVPPAAISPSAIMPAAATPGAAASPIAVPAAAVAAVTPTAAQLAAPASSTAASAVAPVAATAPLPT